MTIIVAIDGPSGSGKSSTAKSLARRAKWSYLDTGALYRATTWLALEKGLKEESEIAAALEERPISISTDAEKQRIKVQGQDVTSAIREERVTSAVSVYSAMPNVRRKLVELQKIGRAHV